MITVLIKVSAFLFIILAGIWASRSGKLGNDAGDLLSKIVFNLTLPAAIVHAFGSADFTPQLLLLIPVGLACALGPYLVAYIATRRSTYEDRIFYLMNVSGFNIGAFGLPFVQAFFPASTVVAACMFDAGNSLMMSSGTYALTSVLVSRDKLEHPVRTLVRRLVSSATFDCYLVLIALALAGIHLPDAVVQFTEPMANANAFLSMFMLGLMVSFEVDAAKLRKLLRLLAGRFSMCFALSLAAYNLLPFGFEIRCIVTVLLWAPIGAMGPVFTLWAKGDHGLAGLANTITIFTGILVMTTIIIMTGSF